MNAVTMKIHISYADGSEFNDSCLSFSKAYCLVRGCWCACVLIRDWGILGPWCLVHDPWIVELGSCLYHCHVAGYNTQRNCGTKLKRKIS